MTTKATSTRMRLAGRGQRAQGRTQPTRPTSTAARPDATTPAWLAAGGAGSSGLATMTRPQSANRIAATRATNSRDSGPSAPASRVAAGRARLRSPPNPIVPPFCALALRARGEASDRIRRQYRGGRRRCAIPLIGEGGRWMSRCRGSGSSRLRHRHAVAPVARQEQQRDEAGRDVEGALGVEQRRHAPISISWRWPLITGLTRPNLSPKLDASALYPRLQDI